MKHSKTRKFPILMKFFSYLSTLVLVTSISSLANIDENALILKFKTLADVPEVSSEEGRLFLTFNDSEITKFFENYSLRDFRMEYPAAVHFSGPKAEDLQKNYILSFDEHYLNVWNKMPNALQKYFSDIRERHLMVPEQMVTACCSGNNDPDEYVNEPGQHGHLDLINASDAWCITRGSSDISIGITDIEFSTGHRDLEQKFLNGSNDECVGATVCQGGHGTMVSGLAAGHTNNGIDIASIGYHSTLREYAIGLNDILQASADGASVVNCSWRTCANSINLMDWQSGIDMVNNNGTIVVASSGNGNYGGACFGNGNSKHSGQNNLCADLDTGVGSGTSDCNGYAYPASLARVISVGGVTNGGGGQNVFSRYDAYGGTIAASEPSRYSTFNDSVDLVSDAYLAISTMCFEPTTGNCQEGRGFTSSGTSFAGPVVAGICALIKSVNPGFDHDDVELFLKSTAWSTNAMDSSVFNSTFGAGIPNAGAALEAAVLAVIPDYDCNPGNLVQEEDFECAGLLYVTAENDGIVNDCNGIQLSAQMTYDAGICSYKWSPSTGLSSSNIANPIAIPDNSTHYKVRVTKVDSAGRHCSWEDWIWVHNSLNCDPPTCTDGIKNGSETGVDCGGTCPPCKVHPWLPCMYHWRIGITPNPFKNKLKVSLRMAAPCIPIQGVPTKGQEFMRVIHSSSGSLLHEEVIDGKRETLALDSSKWPKGQYAVYIVNEKGKILGATKALKL